MIKMKAQMTATQTYDDFNMKEKQHEIQRSKLS